MKYIVSYKTKFGTVAAETNNPRDLVGAYAELKRLASTVQFTNSGHRKIVQAGTKREGKGETTTILRTVELRLLASGFFSKPRTTGETREKLSKLTRRKYTSRKVSQALGILHDKGALRRTGRRNFFKYSIS